MVKDSEVQVSNSSYSPSWRTFPNLLHRLQDYRSQGALSPGSLGDNPHSSTLKLAGKRQTTFSDRLTRIEDLNWARGLWATCLLLPSPGSKVISGKAKLPSLHKVTRVGLVTCACDSSGQEAGAGGLDLRAAWSTE